MALFTNHVAGLTLYLSNEYMMEKEQTFISKKSCVI